MKKAKVKILKVNVMCPYCRIEFDSECGTVCVNCEKEFSLPDWFTSKSLSSFNSSGYYDGDDIILHNGKCTECNRRKKMLYKQPGDNDIVCSDCFYFPYNNI